MEDLQAYFKSLEEVVSDGFARYSKYIIQDRAIPDARDGLKPVQRRILYAMYHEKNFFNKPYRKSAKSVGVVIGNYHPHGDSSVYDALVRLSQDFKLNHPLIDMQGNNGSIDGDPAAAMRYTEARLSAIAMKLLEDVNKQTVLMAPNFDDTELEPTVLPAYFPNLLVNGSTGISAGYATDIPSHNLEEIINACIYRINNEDSSLNDILKIVKGPDFCTGGIIQGKDEMKKAYQSGKGRIVVRAKLKVEVVKNIKQIIISEIPYEVNKADLVRSIEEIIVNKKIDGILAIRDESDRQGLSVVIDLKKDCNDTLILNYLYKNTKLQDYYNFNMVAIVNRTPKRLGLLALLDAYINHQKDVLTKLSTYELDVANKRLHIVEGLINAVDVIDEIVQIIRDSNNRMDSINNLRARFNFTQVQAEAIVDLRLYRLSNTDIKVLEDEHENLLASIRHLSAILSDSTLLDKEIINKLELVRDEFKVKRRSKIESDIEEININKEDLIADEEVMISISKDGYIKRSSLRSYQASNEDIVKKEDDFIFAISKASTLDRIILFLDNGYYALLPVYDLLETKWKDFGKHLNNYVSGLSNEKIVNALLINDFNTNKVLVSVSKNGLIKYSKVSDLELQRYNKIVKYFNIKGDDLIINNSINDCHDDVIISSKKGYIIRFNLHDFSETGLKASGIKAIKLNNDEVSGMVCASPISLEQLFIICDNGNTKRISVANISLSNRFTKGVLFLKEKKSNPDYIIKMFKIDKNTDIFVTDSSYNVSIIKAFDTSLSSEKEGLRKALELKDTKVIDACIIEDLHLNTSDSNNKTNLSNIEEEFETYNYDEEEQMELEFDAETIDF